MTAYDEAVQRYFAAWNAATDEELAKAVAAAFTEGATYTDPLADVRGHEELAATIDGAHQQFPGFEFRLSRHAGRTPRHRALRLGAGLHRRRLGTGHAALM